MNAGLEVINDANTIQIDMNWANYALKSVTTLYSNVNSQWSGPRLKFGAVLHGTTDDELVFVYCEQAFSSPGPSFLFGARVIAVGTFASGVPVTFYVFKKQPPVQSNFGLQVFDGTGGILFDATSNFARIKFTMPTNDFALTQQKFYPGQGATKVGVLFPSWTGQFVQFDSGAGSGNMAWRYLQLNGPRLVCENGGVRTIGYGIYAETQIPIQNPSGGIIISNAEGADYIVADMSGY